jgi:isopentenyl-diphosphate delta-isomerase
LNPEHERGVPAGDPDAIARRKADHLRLATSDQHQSGGAGWADIHLIHDALPVVDADDIDLATDLLGHRLRLPLVIAGMTGGHPLARDLNATLARAAERHGIVMGVGSQRAALRDPRLADTYAIAREVAPDAVLLANVGVSQLIDQEREAALSEGELRAAVDMIAADALVIHLNYLEESVQPEGQRRAHGLLEAIARTVRAVDVPVVLKETGAGLSREVAVRARDVGIMALDVGGHGGTSFASIEAERAAEAGDLVLARLGHTFASWGIPTPASVAACAEVLPVIATGGLRSGLDAARAVALGATAVGIGRPLLQAAMVDDEALDLWIRAFEHELRTAVFLTGGRGLRDLRSARRVVTGPMAAWLAHMTD